MHQIGNINVLDIEHLFYGYEDQKAEEENEGQKTQKLTGKTNYSPDVTG